MKRSILAAAAAAGIALAAGTAIPASASTNPVVGNYVIADHGPGCWVGGQMYANGTLGGGGECAFGPGGPGAGSIVKITPISWVPAGSGLVALNADFQLLKGPDIGIMTVDVPANAGMVALLPFNPGVVGPDTYGKVTLHR